MKLNVSCEQCGSGILGETNVNTVFYCPTCDCEYDLNELEVEVISE